MSLFAKHRKDEPGGDLDRIVALASAEFAAGGVPVTVAPGTSGVDTTLITASGGQYPLYNLLVRLRQLPDSEHADAVRLHVSNLVAALDNPPHESLDVDAVEAQIRARLVHFSLAGTIPLAYARPFAGDLVVALCLDTPTTVEYVPDGFLADRDVNRLFEIGLANTLAEPTFEVQEVTPGVLVIEGESFFTASKTLGFDQMMGSTLPYAPLGIVFGVPNRHLIVAHIVRDMEVVQAIGYVARLTAMQAGPEAPGGPLSSAIFYSRDGVVDSIGGVGEHGGIDVYPSDRLVELLNSFPAK